MTVFKLHAPIEDGVKKIKQGLEKLKGALFQRPPLISAVKRQLRVRTVYDSLLCDYDETRNIGELNDWLFFSVLDHLLYVVSFSSPNPKRFRVTCRDVKFPES